LLLTLDLIEVGTFVRRINQKNLYADVLYVLFGLTAANDKLCFSRTRH
jgi:hypothetical protein